MSRISILSGVFAKFLMMKRDSLRTCVGRLFFSKRELIHCSHLSWPEQPIPRFHASLCAAALSFIQSRVCKARHAAPFQRPRCDQWKPFREPIVIDNDEALERLDGLADAYLMHNRDIFMRVDDSVVRVSNGKTLFIRRSRGYVPSL